MEINQIIHGFRLLRKTFIKEIESTAYLFSHEKSGARLFYLENKDDNKVFSISFRTPPVDDTGVAHIVEHSVLCGSRKYPLKEPFVELVKGSLNTFLNAMTYPDKTMYPVASRNDKDFQNLMDVYLDAVFYPEMRENPEILMQEGWHYEIADESQPLSYSGVVYNEMKGALSSPDDLLESRIMTSLYPDTTYGRESGGDPEVIPTLTQEAFIGFHSRYYHPSNSYIYLYGAMDIEAKLRYIDEEYLSAFDRIEVPSVIAHQKPFSAMQTLESPYPLGKEEQTEGKTFLALNFLTGDVLDKKEMLGLEILEHALLRSQAAPLRKALIDAKLGKDVDSIFEDDILQPFFSIIVNNSEKAKKDDFLKVTRETLEGLVRDGIDKTLLEASLNRLEFLLREADFSATPKGLVYGIRIMNSWLYDGAPENDLFYEENLAALREGLKGRYFESLIEKYFLMNKHASLVILYPDTEMTEAREKKQAEELAARKAAMTKDEIAGAIAAVKKLKKRQETPDSEEALKTIPVLSRADIRREIYDLPLEERSLAGAKVLFSDVDTQGITYLDFLFDTRKIPQEDIHYLSLIATFLTSVATKKRGYEDLANRMNLLTGGITTEVVVYTRKDDPDSYSPYFRVRVKALTKKLPEVADLLGEIFTESLFDDKKRIRELIEQDVTSFELSLQRSATQLINTRIESYLTDAGSYTDESGLPHYEFLKAFLKDFDASFALMQEKIKSLLPRLFNKDGFKLGVTMKAADYREIEAPLGTLIGSFATESYPVEPYKWTHEKKDEGFMSASRVQYVAKGANFVRLGYHYTGALAVLTTMLRYDYFWTRIRVQGGAYGAFTHFSRDGSMSFGSYRDPHLRETLDVFDGTADYVKNFAASDREMDKFIIGTMSSVDMPLTPKMKGQAALGCYMRGITAADRQKSRDEILATHQQEIHALAPLIDDCMKENALCVFGGEEAVRAAKDVFGSIKAIKA